MAKKLRVGILFGGRSGEHEVSLLSASSILKEIDRTKFEVVLIGINKAGQWLTSGSAQGLLDGSGQDAAKLDGPSPAALPSAGAAPGTALGGVAIGQPPGIGRTGCGLLPGSMGTSPESL